MPRLPRRTIALSSAVLALIAIAVACQDPTQVTIRITTGEACNNISVVQTIVGPNPIETQARFERGFSSAAGDACDAQGLVGTLVVTPGGTAGSILVAVGVGTSESPPPDATRCGEPEIAKRCIIARRIFSFIENTRLTLPIHLDPLCIGKSCDPASTCFAGSCVDAATICTGSNCGLQEELGGEGVGGANDAGSSDGAYDADLDGPGFEDDGGGVADAMPDSDARLEDATTGTYPPCAFSTPTYYCSSGANGTITSGSCDGANPGMSCCRCTCPTTATTVGCSTTTGAACSGLTPSCPLQ